MPSERNESLFQELVAPALKKATQLQRQFERLESHDVTEHQHLLNEIEQADHQVWQAIALATADLNPSLIKDVSRAQPMPLTSSDCAWITRCLAESRLPLIDEGEFAPIRFLPFQ